jgi:hypothetical protein
LAMPPSMVSEAALERSSLVAPATYFLYTPYSTG